MVVTRASWAVIKMGRGLRRGRGTGTVSGSPCTLSPGTTSSTCSVTYTPTAGAGTHNITGTYGGDASFLGSDNSASPFAVTVTKRHTSTSVSCAPSSLPLAASTTCTATVSDTESSGTKSAPSGTVAFASSGTGTVSGSPCTLSPGTTSSTCSVTYTPTAGAGTHNITGTYG